MNISGPQHSHARPSLPSSSSPLPDLLESRYLRFVPHFPNIFNITFPLQPKSTFSPRPSTFPLPQMSQHGRTLTGPKEEATLIPGTTTHFDAAMRKGSDDTPPLLSPHTSSTSPRASPILTHLTVSLSLVHMKLGGSDVQEILDILLDGDFDLAAFRYRVRTIQDCTRMTESVANDVVGKYCGQDQ